MTDRSRGDKRFPSTQSLQVRCQNWADFAQLYASDVSQGGMFIATTIPLPILSELDIELSLPEGHQIQLKAIVVHLLDAKQAAIEQRSPGVGVQFIQLEPEQKKQIQQLVEFAQRAGGADATLSLASHLFESALSTTPSQLFTIKPPGDEPAPATIVRPRRTRRISQAVTTRPGADTDLQVTLRPSADLTNGSNAPSSKPTLPAAQVPSKPVDAAKLKLGMTQLAHKDFGEAIKTFSEVAQESGGNLEAHQWLLLAKARKCLHDDDPSGASEHYQNVLNIDEENHEARKFVREHHSKKRLESLPFGRFFVKKT